MIRSIKISCFKVWGVLCAMVWCCTREGDQRDPCCLWVLADGGASHWSNNHFCVLRTFEYAAYFNTCGGMIFSAFSGYCIFDVDAVVLILLLCCSRGPCKFCLPLLPSISYCFVFIFKAQPFLVTSNHRSPSVAGFLNQNWKTLCNLLTAFEGYETACFRSSSGT